MKNKLMWFTIIFSLSYVALTGKLEKTETGWSYSWPSIIQLMK